MRVFFVSDRDDSHSDRFSNALSTCLTGFESVRVTCNGEGVVVARVAGLWRTGWSRIREALDAHSAVVLSGPLDSVTSNLRGLHNPHIGVSWSTDVMVTAAMGERGLRQWQDTLGSLYAVVVDNVPVQNACIAAGISPKAIIRFPWGPEDQLPPSSARRHRNLPGRKKIVLFGRRLDPHYDPLTFVEALFDLRRRGLSAVWTFVSQGPMVDDVKAALGSGGFDQPVSWIAPATPLEFNALISRVDCVVSTALTDGSSVTVLEALRASVPVVATQSAGVSEWVIDGITGWTVPVGNSAALARAIESVLIGPEDRRDLITENGARLVGRIAGWHEGLKQLVQAVHLASEHT